MCYKHTDQIIHALNIKSADIISSWRLISKNKNEEGTQIDLLIDRSDNAITLCEIKYTNKPFVISKQYAEILRRKITVFKETTKTKKQIFLTLISANGINENEYSNELIDHTITQDVFFRGS